MNDRIVVDCIAGRKTDGSLVREELLVEVASDGTMLVVATPALVLGVAAGDRINVTPQGECEVLIRGGNLAVQVFSDDQSAVGLLAEAFSDMGGRVDARAPGLTVFTISVTVGFAVIEGALRNFVQRVPGAEWYYGNVYADDGETPMGWWE